MPLVSHLCLLRDIFHKEYVYTGRTLPPCLSLLRWSPPPFPFPSPPLPSPPHLSFPSFFLFSILQLRRKQSRVSCGLSSWGSWLLCDGMLPWYFRRCIPTTIGVHKRPRAATHYRMWNQQQTLEPQVFGSHRQFCDFLVPKPNQQPRECCGTNRSWTRSSAFPTMPR